ncbi:MAG: TlpA family protein disulfide reductase [Pseudobdellovibrionaceae bacterium]
MNKHYKALLIVGGIIAFILLGFGFYYHRTQEAVNYMTDSIKGPVQINEKLSDFEVKNLQGVFLKLSQFKGKVIIINFWASWCGPCVEEVPSLIKLMKAFPDKLELIAISGDSTEEEIYSFLKSFPEMNILPNIHVVWDKDKHLSQQYQIYRLPESLLLNKDLKLVKKVSGAIDWHTGDAIAYIQQLISF